MHQAAKFSTWNLDLAQSKLFGTDQNTLVPAQICLGTYRKTAHKFWCPTWILNLKWLLVNEFPFPGNLLRCLARRNKKRFPPNSQSIYHKWQKKLRAFRDQSLMSMKRVGMLTCSAAIRVGQNISKSYASIFYCKKGFRPTVSMFMDHKWQKKLRV